MVFRYFLGNLIREAAQERLQEATAGAQDAAQRNAARKCDLLIAMALPIESGGLVDKLHDVEVLAGRGYTERFGHLPSKQHDRPLAIGIVETGVGEARAAEALRGTISARDPQWVISAGLAGGLDETLQRNHFLMADTIVHAATGEQLSVGLSIDKETLTASPGVHVGRLLTVDRIVRDPDEKHALGQQHDALACDMETYAVAQVCQAAQRRFLSVRIISDKVDDALPKEIEKLIDQKTTAAQLGAAAAALWNRPSSAKDMWKLKEDAMQASDRLAKFLLGVIKQLPIDSQPAISQNEDCRAGDDNRDEASKTSGATDDGL